jgi:hypothetical protein
MDQHEYVRGALAYYAENGYEPGNPEDGEWHDCHYPVPKCLGGTETIKLLKQHHAVQGVLQSEEYQRCCICTWEVNYLDGEHSTLARKWMSEGARTAALQQWTNIPPEERSDRNRRGWASLTPDERFERTSRASRTRWANKTPEERSAIMSERSRKAWEKRRNKQRE